MINKVCELDHEPLIKELLDKGMVGSCPDCDEVLVPAFCVICGKLLNPSVRDQTWFWNGSYSNPQHFSCR